MKLSKLVYKCVKNATDFGDPSFTYLAFIDGEAAKSPDYSSSIDKSILDINAFFQRLSALDKVPVVTIENADVKNGLIDLSKEPLKVKKIVSVCQIQDGRVKPLKWLKIGKSVHISNHYNGLPVIVQYRPEIPNFDESSIPYCEAIYDEYDEFVCFMYKGERYESEQEVLEAIDKDDIDLFDKYGIPETAMPLCMDYVKSLQGETDPSSSHALMIETESRILDLVNDEEILGQTNVEVVEL